MVCTPGDVLLGVAVGNTCPLGVTAGDTCILGVAVGNMLYLKGCTCTSMGHSWSTCPVGLL